MERILTLHFVDGSKMSLAFEEQAANTAARKIKVDKLMASKHLVVEAGDQVLILYGSANHDEAVFPDPDVLDVGREVRSHWTFGRGIHHCLGNAVARLEVRVALEALLEAHPDFGVDEGGIVRNQLVPTRGVAHAPIDF